MRSLLSRVLSIETFWPFIAKRFVYERPKKFEFDTNLRGDTTLICIPGFTLMS